MEKKYGMLFALALVIIAGGCGSATSPVLKTITIPSSGGEKEYSIIYDNGKASRTDAFSPDNALFLFADEGDFVETTKDGTITVTLADTKLTDADGTDSEPDDVIRSLMNRVADNAEHDIFDVTFIIDGGHYYVFEKENVNLQAPCILYEYDKENGSLKELYRWEDVELEGISVDDAMIIGGADGPTSVFLAQSFGGKGIYPELPADPIEFDMGEFTNEDDPEDGYRTIEYNGRTYLPYGTLGKTIRKNDIGTCLGYLVQDGEKLEEVRVYTLTGDTEQNYLMDYSITGFMEQPSFWRAMDTKGKDVSTPDYIDSLGYEYWE